MAVIVSKELQVPVLSKRLSDYAHGEIVKLNESGTPVEFYVAKHDYESGLNGTGRTLLVRKNCYDKRYLDNDSSPYGFVGADLEIFLNGTYKMLFDVTVQTAMGTTAFYYTNSGAALTTISKAIFIPSLTEMGKSYNDYNYARTEGSTLPIASTLQIAYYNGTAAEQWTRTPLVTNAGRLDSSVCCLTNTGAVSVHTPQHNCGYLPCFTLPDDAKFDPDTNEFKGVA